MGLLERLPANFNINYLFNVVIEKIILWIQMRLNTAYMFKHSYCDFLNELYIKVCFNKSYIESLAKKGNTDTNIRNLFFGDCREHEVLLHVLLKIYFKYHNLDNEYKIFKFYGYGTTITNPKLNDLYWTSKSLPKKLSSIGGSRSLSFEIDFPSINNISIDTWEHTHPLLYIERSNTLIAIDALGHKTHINPNMIERHNVILKIETLPVKNRIGEFNYSLWYSNLKDAKSRIYVEKPTNFSKNVPFTTTYKKLNQVKYLDLILMKIN